MAAPVIRWQNRLWWTVLAMGLLPAPALAANTVTIGSAAGYPGETRTITVSMDNTDPISGLQFTLRDVPDNLKALSVSRASRLASFSTPSFNDSLGVVKIVIFGFGTRADAGSGPIFTITFKIADNAAPGTVPIIVDQIVLATPSAQTVQSKGVNGSMDVLPPISVTDHPVRQPDNQFDKATGTVTRDLYRYALSIPFFDAAISRLAFHANRGKLSTSALVAFSLHEDANGDGTADGAPLSTSATITPDSLIFANLSIPLTGGSPRYFIVRGTVQLSRRGDQLKLTLASNGISATFTGPGYTAAATQFAGSVAEATHLATSVDGDVNGDFRINVSDIVRVVRVILGLTVSPEDIQYADVDANGRVDVTDAVNLIQRILSGQA